LPVEPPFLSENNTLDTRPSLSDIDKQYIFSLDLERYLTSDKEIIDYFLNKLSTFKDYSRGKWQEWNNNFVKNILGYQDVKDTETTKIVKAIQTFLANKYGEKAVSIDGKLGANTVNYLTKFLTQERNKLANGSSEKTTKRPTIKADLISTSSDEPKVKASGFESIRDSLFSDRSFYYKVKDEIMLLSLDSNSWSDSFVKNILGYKNADKTQVESVIKDFQRFLAKNYPQNSLAVDGQFGPKTRKLLVRFMNENIPPRDNELISENARTENKNYGEILPGNNFLFLDI
jgi:hypothetical protein